MHTNIVIFKQEKTITQYLFLLIISLDLIFFVLKGLRASIWETTKIFIGGKNPSDVNFAIVQNQVRFIDTTKYYQQSLAGLAASMTDIERENVRKNYRRFLAEKLMLLNKEQEKWMLNYLSLGKGTIPYQMITDFN